MDGDIYIEPTSRHVDSSDRTDADGGGGGTSFIFLGGNAPQSEEEEKKKVKKPVDFGKPVEVELSSAVTEKDAEDEEEDSGSAYYAEDEEYDDSEEESGVVVDLENHPDSSPGHHPGTKINFTI